MLNGVRRFAYASIGDPYARLLSGIALERIGRSEDALAELEAGLAGLAPEDAERIRDPGPLLDSLSAEHFAGLRWEARVRAEASFWRALDPLLSTEVNERLVAHLAHSAYAHLRLGGSHTDAGEVWVRYGEPLSIRAVGAGTELRTELWDYGGGPAVTFRKLATSSMRDLTSEARAYLEDLRATRPHSYGTGGREVSALTAAVSRFRGPSSATEFEVVTRVPEPLISGTDTVEFALIQLDGNGERVASRRRRVVPGATLPARFWVHERESELAVEIYNPILARGATLRVPVGRDAGSVGPTASDLQLVAAVARPEREVVRGASWILPLSDRRMDAPEVGVLFELYDLPGAGPYRLRLELVPVAGGAARPIEFRPAGHARFGWSFARAPWPGPTRSTEYVTMRLEGVSSGNYLLRAIAELPDGRAIVSERWVERK